MSGKGYMTSRTQQRWLCLVLGTVITLPFALAAHELARLRGENLHQRTILRTHHVITHVETELNLRFDRLRDLAAKLAEKKISSEKQFWDQAMSLVLKFTDLKSIKWIDKQNRVRWVVLPENPNQVTIAADAASSTDIPVTQSPQQRRQPRASGLINLTLGRRGFAAYFPVLRGPFQGTVSSVFELDSLLQSLLPDELHSDITIALVDSNETTVHAYGPPHVERAIGILGQGFTLIVSPKLAYKSYIDFASLGLLLFGLCISVVTAGLAYQLLDSRAHLLEEQMQQRSLLAAAADHMLRLAPDLSTLAYHPSPYDTQHLPCHLPPEQWMPPTLQSSIEQSILEGHIIESEEDIDNRHYEVRIVPDTERHLVLSLRDVTVRMELTSQHVLLARVIASSAHLAAVLGPDGRVEYLNPIGRQILILDSTPHRLDDILELSEDILSPLEGAVSWSGRLNLRASSGEEVPVHLTSFAIPTAHGPRLGLTAVDLRQTVQLEQQLEQAHKMEALGTLAAGVAHDFNNAVTVFQTGVELLEGIDNMPEEAHEDLSLLRSAASSAANVASQLLAFARPTRSATQPFILDKVLSASAQMIARSVRADIDIEWSLRAKDARVLGDPGALQQALLNLVINARDAIPATGVIAIHSEMVVRNHQEFVIIKVIDTGTGVPLELQKKIFEPFFTTKPKGQGSGLGLAMVRRVIDGFEGNISIQSQSGEGTSVVLELPTHQPEVEELTQSIDLHQQHFRAARIILVEDDPPLRTLIQRGLSQAGHQVEVATDGIEAIKLLSDPTDVLITDVIMPRMGGVELARRARRENPAIHILLITGHPELPPEHTLPLGVEIIPKPLALAHLLRTVDKHVSSMPRAPTVHM